MREVVEALWLVGFGGTHLPLSLLRGFPLSCLPHAARRFAAHRSAIRGLDKRALFHSSSLPIQFTVSDTFTSCDSGPFSSASMSLLGPRRLREPVLLCFFLSWAGQRAPVYLLFKTCRALNGHIVLVLVSPFLASFEALRERKGASYA